MMFQSLILEENGSSPLSKDHDSIEIKQEALEIDEDENNLEIKMEIPIEASLSPYDMQSEMNSRLESISSDDDKGELDKKIKHLNSKISSEIISFEALQKLWESSKRNSGNLLNNFGASLSFLGESELQYLYSQTIQSRSASSECGNSVCSSNEHNIDLDESTKDDFPPSRKLISPNKYNPLDCSKPNNSSESFVTSQQEAGKLSNLSDSQLMKLAPRELNTILKSLPKPVQRSIKQRRRRLKNRFYAQTCRVKRQSYRQLMELENTQLKEEVLKWQTAFLKLYNNYRLALCVIESNKKRSSNDNELDGFSVKNEQSESEL